MAIDTEPKRWSMLAFASGAGRNIVFNPDTSGLVSIEQITVLKYYGGIAWGAPVAPALPARNLNYIPGPVPYNGEELVRYLEFELYRISAVLSILISGFTTKVYAEPTRPRDGDIVLADGTEWNPGSGEGVYCYYNNTWNKL